MENDNLNELEQLKAQYETLKQQFDQQEIVNDRLMKSAIKHSADFYRRYRWIQVILYPLAALFGLLYIQWNQDNNLTLKLFWLSYLAVCLFFELWLTRKLQVRTLENNDLLTLSNNARSFKKLFSIFTILNYSVAIILIMGLLLYRIGNTFLPNFGAVMLVFCLFLLICIPIGIAEVRYKTKACDEIISQIEASETRVNRKSNFDKQQKWFCLAMIAVFFGFDVWAVLIDASFLKRLTNTFPTYERPVGDRSSTGSLEIWEVYNTTSVEDKTRFLDTTAVEDNDSLAYRWSADTSELVLYTLKKTTETGPAISSALLGRKPLVKRVEPEPYNKGTSTSVMVSMMPEATLLFTRMTENALLQPKPVDAAVVMDGKVYQKWRINNVVGTGGFFIYTAPDWSKEEVEAFCGRLIRE